MNYAKGMAWAALAAMLVFASIGQAREGEKPYSWTHPTKNTPAELARLQLPAVDRAARLQEDARVANPAAGAFEKRLRIGTDQSVQAQPKTDGTWETLPDGRRLWRLVVSSANATDLRFGFSSFRLPKGAMLTFIDNAGHNYDGPYDDTDATADGQFWTAPIAGSEITLELLLPANTELADGALVLSSVSTGYRDIMARDGKALLAPTASGTCNIDVACPLGDNYRNEIRAVAKYTFSSSGSTYLCTGTLVMNTARDFRPFFLTANHCISTQTEASTIALIWNYQSPTCGQHGGGSTAQTQTGGTTLRAHRADVDFTLVELNQMPPASYNVYYAGWDVSGIAPGGSIGIHHPSGDVKAITQGIGTLPTINSCIGTGGVATHWRTGAPYSQGTTEGGSSGSAILVPHGDPNGHQNLIVGTLSGGDAACSGSVPNNGEDCYGKLSVSFNGSSSASRLKDWLDPGSTGVTILAGAPPPSQTSSATTISGSPLTVIVGRDHSFQILNSAIPGVGQVYPSTSSGPADMGWFVRTTSTLYSPDFSSHGSTATGNLGTHTAYTPQSLTGVTGTGSVANPFTVSVGGALGSSGLVATEQVTYASGSNFFTKRFTLKNNGSTSQTVKIFLAADIYLAGSDSGVPFRIASSGTTGGQNCANPANYSILFIPQTATDGYTGASYSSVWSQIGAGTLNNALSSGCIDNGAALQWNRTIAAGASVTIQAATSFGDIPSVFALTVAKSGTGAGTVTSNPSGINCGSTCSANYISGSSVTLAAAAASGSVFSGWSGACSGTGSCTLTMNAAKSVTANFNSAATTYALTVQKSGSGSGTVTSNPSGINCGSTCSANYISGSSVTLAAVAASGSAFSGWSGACSGTGSCTLTMNAAKSVTANFNSAATTYALTVQKSGNGTGTVTSNPSGINCGSTCSKAFAAGTSVTLTASAAAGSQFSAWSGACSGSATCTVSMTSAKSVTATFVSTTGLFALTVSKAGNGFGTVASAPAGINCGATCAASFASGAVVTLTATAASGSTFGWGGACSGSSTCSVTMTAAKSVTATFTAAVAATSAILASGDRHSCALVNGGVRCWGSNNFGQLGDGTTTNRLTPINVIGLTRDVLAIAASGNHTCALTRGGAVKCWGENTNGQIGDGSITTRKTPTIVSGLASGVRAITAGQNHSCAVTTGGGAKCWGSNTNGQLGDGTVSQRLTPVAVSGLSSGVIGIAGGGKHTCALTTGGAVKCFGDNSSSQLGDGTTSERHAPVAVPSLASGVIGIAMGDHHSCALTSTGGVKCWGGNGNGQLGDTTTSNRSTPVTVSGLGSGAVAISAGNLHSCAITSSGTGKCWGGNSSGQLGDGTTTERHAPVTVSGLTFKVIALAPGDFHTCAMLSGGDTKCWGRNSSGQLGNGDASDRTTAVNVVSLVAGVRGIALGRFHSCALTSAAGVKCWGHNTDGQLGDGTTTDRKLPVNVTGLASGVSVIAAGDFHTCVLTSGGAVKCWGGNLSGNLGDGTLTSRTTPVNVTGLSSGVIAVVGGGLHTCALTSAGGVKCWGANGFGQLGDGSTTDRLTPVNVTGATSGIIAITAGALHTCALTTSGGVKCWGYNVVGQIGNGTTTSQVVPANVTGLSTGALGITSGLLHTCALTGSGGMKCWGDNEIGQLGDGTTINRLIPVNVVGLSSGVAAIVASTYAHSCALTSGGAVKCWGDNEHGQLGDGTTTTRLTPVTAAGLSSGATAVDAGTFHTCAITGAGGVKCWGDNTYGQVGDNTTTQRLTAVDVGGLVPIARLRFDGASGPTSKIIVRNSGVPVVFYWETFNLPANTSCRIYLRPNDTYQTSASPIASGTHTETSINTWATGTYLFYLGCSNGTASANVTLIIQTTSATFPLTISKNGNGSGTVTSSPAGISCGSTCSASFAINTTVTLTATASGGGSVFTGWTGACSSTTATCAVTTSAAKTVGAVFAQLGNGVQTISAGYGHTCTLTTAGAMKCWGRNDYGQLGDGTTTDRLTPVTVSGLSSGVQAISAEGHHTCALTTAGAVKCWGRNDDGELGDASTTDRLTPVAVLGLSSGVQAISAGNGHTCALTTAGAVKCWGANNDGELGDGTTTNRLTPVAVLGLSSGVQAISAGYHHTCALTSAGAVKCWGANDDGELGDGTTTSRLTPVAVPGLSIGVQAISAGGSHTCALTTVGAVVCWGWNLVGQLGDGTTTGRLTPVAVSGLSSGVQAISAGLNHTCALTTAGAVKCWGWNFYGQLGNGTTTNRLTPAAVLGL